MYTPKAIGGGLPPPFSSPVQLTMAQPTSPCNTKPHNDDCHACYLSASTELLAQGGFGKVKLCTFDKSVVLKFFESDKVRLHVL
jgi:hypothetical protein